MNEATTISFPAEVNQSVAGFKIHDIVLIRTLRRTGENGEKLGYSFYEDRGEIGLVIQVGDDQLIIKKPDLEERIYKTDEKNDSYYYKLEYGSEIEYEDAIKKQVEKEKKVVADSEKTIALLEEWLHDFRDSVSFIGKLKAFARGINKNF